MIHIYYKSIHFFFFIIILSLTLGVTQKPITSSDQWSLCITHSYINITDWFIKVLGRIRAGRLQWTLHKDPRGDAIRKGEKEVGDEIEKQTGLRLNKVNRISLGVTILK